MITRGFEQRLRRLEQETPVSKVLASITSHEDPVYTAIVTYESESQDRRKI